MNLLKLIKEIVNEKLNEDMKKSRPGIYFIYCIGNEKIYVGSSNNISKRITDHKRALNQNKHYNSYLQNAWNKYGLLYFSIGVLEEVSDKSKLIEREQYWLDYLKSYDNKFGFNVKESAAGGGFMKGRPSWNKGMKMDKNYSGRLLGSKCGAAKLNEEQVLQIKNMLLKGDNSYTEIAKKFKTSSSNITAIVKGKIWAHVAPDLIMPEVKPIKKLSERLKIEIVSDLVKNPKINRRILADKYNLDIYLIHMLVRRARRQKLIS